MQMPTEKGRYRATPVEWAVNESKNHLPQFVCLFSFTEQEIDGEWHDISPDALEMHGYFNLVTGANVLNEVNVEAIKDALGWDGVSIESLSSGEWSDKAVQLYLDFETYNGKSSLKIKYLNPADYEGGGIKKLDRQGMVSLEQKYGPILRAKAGASKPAAKSANGNGSQSPQQRAAWSAFLVKWSEYVGENPGEVSKRDECWKNLLKEIFDEKDPKTATAAEWTTAKLRIEKDYSPTVGGLIPI